MKKHNSNSPPRLAAPMKLLVKLLAGAALLGLVSQNALAAGTASGTNITNLSTLSYTVGGVTQTPIGSSPTGNTVGAGTATSFAVDNKVNLTVVKTDVAAIPVVPGATAKITTFTVTNNGNTTQDFALTLGQNVNTTVNPFGGLLTDNFDATACTVSNIVIATGAMGTYTAADQHINALTADSSATVSVSCSIPATVVNNNLAVVNLLATAHADNASNTLGAVLVETANTQAGVEIVFADIAGSDDAAKDGAHSARDAYLVVSATISVTKTATPICDPFNGSTSPKNIPGAAVQYAITITNTGLAAATMSTVTDTLSAALVFDAKLISGAGIGANCVSPTGSLSASGFGAVAGVGATTYAAPGLAGEAVTAGAAFAGQNLTITYGSLVSPATAVLSGGVLPAGDFVTVYFNAFVQ